MNGEVEPLKVKRRFPLVAFNEIQLPAGATYLVRGVIPRQGCVVVWGPAKCGKTFFVFDLAMHVALGWDYRGRRVAKGTVVYIACEGERGLAARVAAFRQEFVGDVTDQPRFYLVATRLDLAGDHPLLVADIRAQLGEDEPVMVVVDTLNRSLAGSESSDEDMGAYIKGADAVREAFGCAVVIIHHCGIEDRRPRGHTSLAGAADAQIAVRREGDRTIVATVELMKDGVAGAEIRSGLKAVVIGQEEDGEDITSCVIESLDGEPRRPPRPKKINAAGLQALTALQEAMAQGAMGAPPSQHIPADVQVVTKSLWRSYCEKAGIINPKGNPREQLRRIIETLKDADLIGVWDDFVWPVTTRHKVSP